MREAIAWGIEGMHQMAEIYPLGGAADRFHLVDEETGVELPAAKLPFAGKTLLEHLIRDSKRGKALFSKVWKAACHAHCNHDFA